MVNDIKSICLPGATKRGIQCVGKTQQESGFYRKVLTYLSYRGLLD